MAVSEKVSRYALCVRFVRSLAIASASLLLLCVPAPAQPAGGIRTGTVKKIDAERSTLTLTADGADREYLVDAQTRLGGGAPLGDKAQETLKGLKEGDQVQFVAATRDGKDVLGAIRPAPAGGQAAPGDGAAAGAPAPRPWPPAPFDSTTLKSLPDLGKEKYRDFEGGLYPGGVNERPAAHEKLGLALAAKIEPLDAEGKPSPTGKIVLLSVGMSNTMQASQGFNRALAQYAEKNPALVFVNGAQGGMTARAIKNPDDNATGTKYWAEVDSQLEKAGVTRSQVQAVWIKQANAGPREGFPAYARTLQEDLAQIAQMLPGRFANCRLAYLSPRTFGGFATTALNPEPYAFESGFSVKWLVQQQIEGDAALNCDAAKGAVKAPWLSWGPYIWTNGAAQPDPKLPGDKADFTDNDGTHETRSGQDKVGRALLEFLSTDPTAKPWFVRPAAARNGAAAKP